MTSDKDRENRIQQMVAPKRDRYAYLRQIREGCLKGWNFSGEPVEWKSDLVSRGELPKQRHQQVQIPWKKDVARMVWGAARGPVRLAH